MKKVKKQKSKKEKNKKKISFILLTKKQKYGILFLEKITKGVYAMKKAFLKKSLSIMLALLLVVAVVPMTALEADAAAYTGIVRQLDSPWQDYYYGGASLSSTGCGLFSLVNCVGYLTGQLMDIPSLASWAHSTGAFNRYGDGTYRYELYPLVEAKYGAQYGISVDCNSDNEGWWEGSSSSLLKTRLQQGYVAIGAVPGHFIAIVGYNAQANQFHVLDSAPGSHRGTNVNGGDVWVTQAALAKDRMLLDWFCFLRTKDGTVAGTVSHKLDGNSYVDLGKDFFARVEHINSGKYLADVSGRVCATDLSGGGEQVWHFMRQASGAYLVGNSSTAKFWDVNGAKYDNGTPLVSTNVNYGVNQKFYIYYTNNVFHFMPEGADKTVDIDATSLKAQVYGNSVANASDVAKPARTFDIEILNVYDGTKVPADLGESFTATIKNSASGKFVTASGRNLIGASRSNANNQKFNFTRLPNGAYTIGSVSENLTIDVFETRLEQGTTVDLHELHGGIAQTFFLIEKDGKYYIKSTYTLNALSMDASSLDFTAKATGEDTALLAAQMFEINICGEGEDALVLKDSSKYSKDDAYLMNVASSQTVEGLIGNFENTSVAVYDSNGKELSASAKIGTGCEVALVVDGEKIDALTVIVKGDVTGDGVVDGTDYLRIKAVFLETYTATGAYIKAADVDESGKVDATDYLRVKGHFLGSYNIFA